MCAELAHDAVMYNVTNDTCAFSAMTSQNACCEKRSMKVHKNSARVQPLESHQQI